MNNEKSMLSKEPFLQVCPRLACAIGLNEAIVLQHLYWLQNRERIGREIKGHRYVFNTYTNWRNRFFPFWSEHTVQRIFVNLEKAGYVCSLQPDGAMSRKKYYRVSEAAVSNLTYERFPDHANLASSTSQSGVFLNSNISTIISNTLVTDAQGTSKGTCTKKPLSKSKLIKAKEGREALEKFDKMCDEMHKPLPEEPLDFTDLF